MFVPSLAYVTTIDDLSRTIQFLLDHYPNYWKKNAVFHWHSLQLESFMALKEKLTKAPILAYPDFFIPFTLYTDTSRDSIGFNLTQVQHGPEQAQAKLFRHWEKVLRPRTRSFVSSGSNSKMQTMLAGQPFYSSCGPPSAQMAYISAWPNWQTSPVGLDPAGIWLHYSMLPRKSRR